MYVIKVGDKWIGAHPLYQLTTDQKMLLQIKNPDRAHVVVNAANDRCPGQDLTGWTVESVPAKY